MSILVVDDSASQRLLITAMLKAAGQTTLAASSAEDTFRLLGMDNPGRVTTRGDLVLMDISMPGMDGIEACRRLKASEGLEDLPVIMVTGSTEAEDLQLAFEAGAMDYIAKPPNKVELLARVRSALRLKSEMDRRKAREQELTEVTQQLMDVNEQLEQTLASHDEEHRLLHAEQEN